MLLLTPLLPLLLWSPVLITAQMLETDPNLCSEAERKKVAEDHERCIHRVEARHTPNGPGLSFTLCQGLNEQVHNCGEHLAKCLSPDDLRTVKDNQIETFTKFLDAQRMSHLYSECNIVREYKNSGRKPYSATNRCSVDQIGDVMKKREQCIARETSAMKSKVRGLSPQQSREQSDAICHFVEKSMHDCTREMQSCYSPSEFEMLTKHSYNRLAQLLVKLNVNFRLESCQNLPTQSPLTESLISSAAGARPTLLALLAMVTAALAMAWL